MAEFDATGRHSATFPRAVDIVDALSTRKITAVELLRQTYAAIEERNPAVNAICTLQPLDEVLPQAENIDAARARGDDLPVLAGIPMAVKDLANTKGIRTTLGSKIFEHNIPTEDGLMIARLKSAGAIIIGKTNTPEFGAGSHTFNELFGITRNPYDTTRIAGGSSGGAAVALATGMVCLSDGSDMGGSLRNPAAYCNVVGFRPTMGRVPSWPQSANRFARMGLEGPMARTVEDCAMLLQVQAGPDPRDRLSYLPTLGNISLTGLQRAKTQGLRLAWAPRPAGLPVEPRILSTLNPMVERTQRLGCTVEEIALTELNEAMAVFKTLRAAAYAMLAESVYTRHSKRLKATLANNIREGLSLTSDDIYQAEIARTQIDTKLQEVFKHYDFILMPTTQVMPFSVDIEYPQSIEGVAMQSYIDWMSICCILSPFDVPCLSLPAGFSEEGLPVGLQIVGRFGDDAGVLQLAYAMQESSPFWQRAPMLDSGSRTPLMAIA